MRYPRLVPVAALIPLIGGRQAGHGTGRNHVHSLPATGPDVEFRTHYDLRIMSAAPALASRRRQKCLQSRTH